MSPCQEVRLELESNFLFESAPPYHVPRQIHLLLRRQDVRLHEEEKRQEIKPQAPQPLAPLLAILNAVETLTYLTHFPSLIVHTEGTSAHFLSFARALTLTGLLLLFFQRSNAPSKDTTRCGDSRLPPPRSWTTHLHGNLSRS